MNRNFKVLLIAQSAFSKTSNNGKTYESIFSALNRENLAQLFFRPTTLDLDFEYCKNYYMVSEVDILKKLTFRDSKCGRSITTSAPVKQQSKSYHVSHKSFKRNPLLRDLLWKTKLWKNRTLIDWCKSTNADLIFFVGANQGFAYDVTHFVADLLKVPIVVYFTDDYIINPISQSLADKIQRRRMQSFYSKMIDRAQMHFCIGALMAEEYSNYFGKKFSPIMNSIELLPFRPISYIGNIRISYFGGLHLNRWKMILRLANVIPQGVKIHVYTFTSLSSEISQLFENSGIVLHGGIKGEALKEAMSNSHILLHVESDDKYNRALTKLSVSTKIPEYLMTGRVVIGFGPIEVASIRLLNDNKIGYVISSSDPDDLIKRSVDTLLADREGMVSIGERAHDYAIHNYDNANNSNKFFQQISSLVCESH